MGYNFDLGPDEVLEEAGRIKDNADVDAAQVLGNQGGYTDIVMQTALVNAVGDVDPAANQKLTSDPGFNNPMG